MYFCEKEETMATHNELGKEGEEESVRFLIEKGYIIHHRNWRSGKYELDIIAQQNDELVIVEVKTRRNTLFGTPESAINNQKIRRILSSTNAYLHKYNIDMNVRFDIITVTGERKPFHIEHIENAFYPPIW